MDFLLLALIACMYALQVDDASSAQVMAMSTDNENITHVGKWSKVRLFTCMQQLTDSSMFRQ